MTYLEEEHPKIYFRDLYSLVKKLESSVPLQQIDMIGFPESQPPLAKRVDSFWMVIKPY